MKHLIHVLYPGEKDFVLMVEEAAGASHRALLENVFAWFNGGSGQECRVWLESRARSLSVGDFVSVNGVWYQCASVGWHAVPESYVHEIRAAVYNHPRYSKGAWFALNEVMWERRKKL